MPAEEPSTASLADLAPQIRDVSFAPKSGHEASRSQSLLSAKIGLDLPRRHVPLSGGPGAGYGLGVGRRSAGEEQPVRP